MEQRVAGLKIRKNFETTRANIYSMQTQCFNMAQILEIVSVDREERSKKNVEEDFSYYTKP